MSTDHAQMTASKPLELKIIKRRENGSGVVSIPICREHQEFDWSKTSGGGPEKGALDLEMLQQMVANFKAYPGPVPIGVSPHVEYGDRAGFSPGFVESLTLRGSVLWAEIDLCAPLFYEVVEMSGWRGFSIEAVRDLELPAAKMDGWVLTGGVFTNRPSADINFKIAADTKAEYAAQGVSRSHFTDPDDVKERGKETGKMEDKDMISLASHEAKMRPIQTELETEKGKVEKLTLRLEAAQTENEKIGSENKELKKKLLELEAEHSAVKANADRDAVRLGHMETTNKQLQAKVDEITAELTTERNVKLAEDVKEVIQAAVSAGVPPAIFDGHQTDPVAWMNARYVNFNAFKTETEKFYSVKGLKLDSAPVKSGHDPAKADDPTPKKPTAVDATVDRMLAAGNVKKIADFSSATNAAEAKAIADAAKADDSK